MEPRVGITREEAEKQLKKVLKIADERLNRTRQDIISLADELHAMQEEFDESDKEMQALWHNRDDRLKEVKEELQRAMQARKKPYFGRIDFVDDGASELETYYIGRSVIAKNHKHPDVIDWRAPIASVYYDNSLGFVTYSVKGEGKFQVDLKRKRTYEIEEDQLKDFYDSDVVANDELLTKYLAKNKRAVLNEIIATIQKEQNEAIRKKPQHNMIVQGAAGSGKTTVAMHRISYILYNYEREFAPEDFYVIGSNQVLLNYITGVLPELNVYGVSQMTMEQLFIRLLYEDWDKKYQVKPVVKGVTPKEKGTLQWFRDLEGFADAYERTLYPIQTIALEKTGAVLLTKEEIEKLLVRFKDLSRADKIDSLTSHLMARLENEIAGKYYTYNAIERQRLTAKYSNYFGKREWKGSIFDLYTGFCQAQNAAGHRTEIPENSFDVYDLAALAYLYKRFKETEIIRGAGHVVIDEAQAFGMMVYCSLKYCLSKCTYTIMGDVAQNISLDYGLTDWQELRQLMLPGEFDYFGLLQKSYRNTVEISEFATNILHHGSFSVYPVQPIIRHGKEVRVTGKDTFAELIMEAAETLKQWQKDGLETMVVICRDEQEAKMVTESLEKHVEILPNDTESMEFRPGILVLSLEYTKGLEFDAVLIFDASAENYPSQDGYVKRLYVAATRALHELVVLHQGKVTPLISEPVSEDALAKAIVEPDRPAGRTMPREEEQTTREIELERAAEGAKDMAEREKFGPRRIQVTKPGIEEKPVLKKVKITGNASTIPTYMERREREMAEKLEPADVGEFGQTPGSSSLQVIGHSKADGSVRLTMKQDKCYDIISRYGLLRVMPVAEDVVRVSFVKGQDAGKIGAPEKRMVRSGFKYKVKDARDILEITTGRMITRIDKKTGAVSFYNNAGKKLLTESEKEPRIIEKGRAYCFFSWDKKENLIARGPSAEKMLRMGLSAKYISYGNASDRMPALASDKGYEIYFPANCKTLCCSIPMYGPYIMQEGREVVDYYVKL